MSERHAQGEASVCVPEEEWERRRQMCDQDFLAYYPSLFHGRTMRSMHEFLEEEMLTTMQELEQLCCSLAPYPAPKNPRKSLWGGRSSTGMQASGASFATAQHMTSTHRQRIVFVCLEDVRLPPQLASETGSLVAALGNLEVLILKGVGLSSIEHMRGTPRLLYLDVSANGLFALDEVLHVVRDCKSLLWADFEGNPCLADGEAEAKVLAVSSWTLRHLNKQRVETRRKVAAIMKHGDPSARSTLCYQVWDAQVCNSHGVVGKPNFEPCNLDRLELPAAGLSVFHIGLFTALTLLDLSVSAKCIAARTQWSTCCDRMLWGARR